MSTDSKNPQQSKDSSQATTARSGKRYHRPDFRDYGSVRDLTRSGAGANPDASFDGGVDGGLDNAQAS